MVVDGGGDGCGGLGRMRYFAGMKKTIYFIAIAIFLLSWGVTGHRTVGKIAEKHLTPAAKAAVQELLGSESLADVSTWADEVRGQAEYRQTGPWHYINLPLGLNYTEFQQRVEGMSDLERLGATAQIGCT